MTIKKRNALARMWLNDLVGGWSVAEIVGTLAVLLAIGWCAMTYLPWSMLAGAE